jgi:hypothetical protein
LEEENEWLEVAHWTVPAVFGPSTTLSRKKPRRGKSAGVEGCGEKYVDLRYTVKAG